jgi:hypothetical protein
MFFRILTYAGTCFPHDHRQISDVDSSDKAAYVSGTTKIN